MSFNAALFRELPPQQYGESMTDTLSGVVIPKSLPSNLAWRRKLLRQAEDSLSFRRSLVKASASSPVFWLNAFGWTFLQKKIEAGGKERSAQGSGTHVPFITWWIQDRAILELKDAIDNGHDALIHKSRDMGATWLVVALFQWYFQFRPHTTFLEISRKEILVDRRGDLDSLFEKHRYLMKWQPSWMQPRKLVDRQMHLENQEIGTTIEGESTNENAGQASRKTGVFIDEAARIRDLEQIELATADTTPCRIFNSTPQGPNTHFTRLFRQFRGGLKAGKLIMLPWWFQPAKGSGARVETDSVGNEEVTSPWKEEEKKRRSKRDVAQNIDGEHGRAGDMFFDADEIEQHRRAHEQEPRFTGAIQWMDDFNDDQKDMAIARQRWESVVFMEKGGWNPWRFWVPLVNNRPSQTTQYVFGIDISNGSGASNSVITVLDHYSNQVVAKFWDAFTTPEDLAEEVAKAQLFFGGDRPARVIFEKNGPGISFGRKLVTKLQVPNIYYQEIVDGRSKQKTSKWGWHSSNSRKELLLRNYRDALKAGTVINPCKEALDEALDYVYNDKGKIEPGTMGAEDRGGSALHGDHVIADALVLMARERLPRVRETHNSRPPRGSYAARRNQFRKRQREADPWKK